MVEWNLAVSNALSLQSLPNNHKTLHHSVNLVKLFLNSFIHTVEKPTGIRFVFVTSSVIHFCLCASRLFCRPSRSPQTSLRCHRTTASSPPFHCPAIFQPIRTVTTQLAPPTNRATCLCSRSKWRICHLQPRPSLLQWQPPSPSQAFHLRPWKLPAPRPRSPPPMRPSASVCPGQRLPLSPWSQAHSLWISPSPNPFLPPSLTKRADTHRGPSSRLIRCRLSLYSQVCDSSPCRLWVALCKSEKFCYCESWCLLSWLLVLRSCQCCYCYSVSSQHWWSLLCWYGHSLLQSTLCKFHTLFVLYC